MAQTRPGEYRKYASREEAARDIVYLLERLVSLVEQASKKLEKTSQWSRNHEEALRKLKKAIGPSTS